MTVYDDSLDRLWESLLGSALGENELDARLGAMFALVPHGDEEPYVEQWADAQNAAAALFYALQCAKTGTSTEAAQAADNAYEVLERYADTDDPDREMRELLAEQELRRQHADLTNVLATAPGAEHATVRQLRARARRDAGSVFTIAAPGGDAG